MAKKAKDARRLLKLRNQETGYTYYTEKNYKNTTNKLSFKKYDPKIRKHILFTEVK